MIDDALRKAGLARLLRLLITLSIPPLWFEIAVLHYRGSFQSRYMVIPVASLPPAFLGGIISNLTADDHRSRLVMRPVALELATLGIAGTFFHLRGVQRQMGGFENWQYNVMTGPPFPAPPHVAIAGILATLASTPPDQIDNKDLIQWIRACNTFAYALLAIEAGYEHYKGYFFNKVMFTPVILSPTLMLIHMGAMTGNNTFRGLEKWLSLAAAVAGLIGFRFHIKNLQYRTGGISWQNLFYGAPVVAPLQLTSQGLLGFLAAFFDEEERE
jgi:hypothetical protein